jgi:hypothetical protein
LGFIAAKACSVEGHNLRIDALLAHAPRDELRHLRAEIDDKDFFVGRSLRHDGF